MERDNKILFKNQILAAMAIGFLVSSAYAAGPVWTFTPLTSATVAVPQGTTGVVQYTVSNQSSHPKNLVLYPTTGISQAGACNLAAKGQSGSSCTLTLNIDGSSLPDGGIQNGPKLCQANSDGSANQNQCYQPSRANVLHAVKLPNVTIGQSFQGGVVACLNNGNNNFIAATVDNSAGIEWGGLGTLVGSGAQSNTDGASNTAAIVAKLGNNGGTPYAAQLCNDYEVDSQANTPCQAGNTCYDDWFLPAGNNLTASGQLNCLYTNRVALDGFFNAAYLSSTELNANNASVQNLNVGAEGFSNKGNNERVRCVRAFTP